MNSVEVKRQIAENIAYVSGGERLLYAGSEIPYVPEEIPDEEKFADAGGGILPEYSWRARCPASAFGQLPAKHQTVTVDGREFAIQRGGRVKASGEILLYFENPDQ